MRKILISFFALSVFLSLSAVEFSTKLYFKDAAGHTDSVMVGYSSIATDSLNAGLGEVNLLNSQIDTTFFSGISDVIADASIYKYKKANYRTKTKFSTYNNPLNQFLSIDIICKNFPITISWNKLLFQDTIRSKSFISASYPSSGFDVGEQPHWLCYDDSLMYYTYNSGNDYSKNYLFEAGNYYIDSINSKPVKIWTLFVGFAGYKFNTRLNTNDIDNSIIYSSPCTNNLNIKFGQVKKRLIQLYSLTGQILYNEFQNNSNISIDVSNLESGMLLLKILENNKVQVYKITKK